MDYRVPRWLHVEQQIPANSQLQLDPSEFENVTAYKWRLFGLSFVGSVTTATAPFNAVNGGQKIRLLAEVGKSGCSDLNLVPGCIGALCGVRRLVRQTFGIHNDAASFNFFSPVRIPRDSGLDVVIQNASTRSMASVTLIAKGITESGKPTFLAGESVNSLDAGASDTIDSADLMNRGKEAIWLHTLCCKTFQVDASGTEIDGSLRFVRLAVNPIKGIQWMPVEVPIPVGCVMPLSHTWNNVTDLGPTVYWFPNPTYLYPEQHLSIKLSNLTDDQQTINVCLFGELEVK